MNTPIIYTSNERLFRAYDTTTGWSGKPRRYVATAENDAMRHNGGCAQEGGYGSAIVVAKDGDRLQDLAGNTIWPSEGMSNGAARWEVTP